MVLPAALSYHGLWRWHLEVNGTEKANKKNLFGLEGVWSNVANLSAVAIMCFLLYQTLGHMREQGAADRQMFKEEMRSLHQAAISREREIRENGAILQQNRLMLEGHQRLLDQLVRSLQDVARELRDEGREGKPKCEKSTGPSGSFSQPMSLWWWA